MPISNNDKLGLLCDILTNKLDYQTLTGDEKEQLALLAHSLLSDGSLNNEILDTLTCIQEQGSALPDSDIRQCIDTIRRLSDFS